MYICFAVFSFNLDLIINPLYLHSKNILRRKGTYEGQHTLDESSSSKIRLVTTKGLGIIYLVIKTQIITLRMPKEV